MKKKIGITMGDPAGIGSEIIVKALTGDKLERKIQPIVIGDLPVMEDALKVCNTDAKINVIKTLDDIKAESHIINLLDLNLLRADSWCYKRPTMESGKAAFEYIKRACNMAVAGEIDAIVTCPINKAALNDAGITCSGHTEILGELTETDDFAMLLHGSKLNVIHVTTHVSMEDTCKMISKERVYKVIRLADEGMKMIGCDKPCIAVAGFNPHSSERGIFGTQEEESIIPAIERAVKEGLCIEGPVSPDIVFTRAVAGYYDIVVAMYHDQGHIPFKLSEFEYDADTDQYSSLGGVNCTVGLPIIRTSVDHGTAYDRAGEGRSNEESLVKAVNTAYVMAERKSNW